LTTPWRLASISIKKMAKERTTTRRESTGVSFTVHVWKEGGKYVSYVPELDLASCGDSVAHARKRLREAVALFLEGASRMGTLEDILTEAGFEKHGNTYLPHRLLARETVRLGVPAAS
jgi:predicted RNase H-like HicB family nuclease